jgi:hypothetical protein
MFFVRLSESSEVQGANCYHVNVLLEANTSDVGGFGDSRSSPRESFAGAGAAMKAIEGHAEAIRVSCRRLSARLDAVASNRC